MELARKLQHREIAKEEKTKSMRRKFTRIFKEESLARVMIHLKRDNLELMEHMSELMRFQIKAIAEGNAEWKAFRVVAALEKAAEKLGVELEVIKPEKRFLESEDFIDFAEMCFFKRFVAVKAIDGNGMETLPVIFNSDMIMMHDRKTMFVMEHSAQIDYSDIFRGLTFLEPGFNRL